MHLGLRENDLVLIKKGAEASLYLEEWNNRKVIMKHRLPKKYRPLELDNMIRNQRTINESHIIHKAKKAGVPTPTIFMVDLENFNIIMEFIEGKQVKEVLENLAKDERREICELIGTMIGNLHKNGIIHGDLTTSNMILTPYRKIVFVDFGLSERSFELEPKGVDLHLMKRTLNSTHFKHAKDSYNSVMEGYSTIVTKNELKKVIKKIEEIEKRGRYVANR